MVIFSWRPSQGCWSIVTSIAGFLASKSFSTLSQKALFLAWSEMTGYIQRVTALLSEPEPPEPHPPITTLRATAMPAAAMFLIGGVPFLNTGPDRNLVTGDGPVNA
ncbi:hypothetical protein ACFQ0B_41765 [Nonomuraea thailandensis]